MLNATFYPAAPLVERLLRKEALFLCVGICFSLKHSHLENRAAAKKSRKTQSIYKLVHEGTNQLCIEGLLRTDVAVNDFLVHLPFTVR